MTDDALIVFVAGLSGSGKSTAMAALEDLSFYSVDNLPPQLVEQFVELCRKAEPPIRKIALAIDSREPAFLGEVPGVVERLRGEEEGIRVLFLDCSDEEIVRRYRETRRVHPHAPSGSVEEGIRVERRLLADVQRLADFVADTSSLNVHQLKETIARQVSRGPRPTVVNLVSFGFRYQTPHQAELLFDVRFLPNPHFEAHLRERTGEDPEVAAYVARSGAFHDLEERLSGLLEFLLPLYDQEGKAYLTVGIGCTGGRHRSVTVANSLAARLEKSGRRVTVSHRDMGRSA